MKYFCIPSDFKLKTVEELHKLNQKSEFYKVKELYGQQGILFLLDVIMFRT